jgi:hypothetical protein
MKHMPGVSFFIHKEFQDQPKVYNLLKEECKINCWVIHVFKINYTCYFHLLTNTYYWWVQKISPTFFPLSSSWPAAWRLGTKLQPRGRYGLCETTTQRPESSKTKRSPIKYDASLLAVRDKNKEAQGQDMKFDSTFSSNSFLSLKFLSGCIMKDMDISQTACSRAFVLFIPTVTRYYFLTDARDNVLAGFINVNIFLSVHFLGTTCSFT